MKVYHEMEVNEHLLSEDEFDSAVLLAYTLAHKSNFRLSGGRRPLKTLEAFVLSNRLSYFECCVFPPHCQDSVNKPET